MPHLASPARSRIARAMLCAHDACSLALLAPPQPDPRAPPSSFMLEDSMLPASRVGAAKKILAPVTRELQLVSMSVRPRYSRAVLVK